MYKGLVNKNIPISIQITKCPFCNSKNISWQTRFRKYRCNLCKKIFDLSTYKLNNTEILGMNDSKKIEPCPQPLGVGE